MQLILSQTLSAAAFTAALAGNSLAANAEPYKFPQNELWVVHDEICVVMSPDKGCLSKKYRKTVWDYPTLEKCLEEARRIYKENRKLAKSKDDKALEKYNGTIGAVCIRNSWSKSKQDKKYNELVEKLERLGKQYRERKKYISDGFE